MAILARRAWASASACFLQYRTIGGHVIGHIIVHSEIQIHHASTFLSGEIDWASVSEPHTCDFNATFARYITYAVDCTSNRSIFRYF